MAHTDKPIRILSPNHKVFEVFGESIEELQAVFPEALVEPNKMPKQRTLESSDQVTIDSKNDYLKFTSGCRYRDLGNFVIENLESNIKIRREKKNVEIIRFDTGTCLLYTSPSPRDS